MARSRTRGARSYGDSWGGDFGALYEKPAARRRRLKQEKTKHRTRAVVIDRSGSERHLERAAKMLRSVDSHERVLVVQHWNVEKAVRAMERAGVTGMVTNICKSETRKVEARARR
jgi:hypothetical protein